MNYKTRKLIKEISKHEGETITVLGWLHTTKLFKDFAFLNLRDRTGIIQCVVDLPDQIELLKSLMLESSIAVAGKVTSRKGKNGENLYELANCELTILNAAEEQLPIAINKPELNLHLDTLLDNRPLALRHPIQQAIFKIHGTVQQAYREFMLKEGATEFFPPTLLAGSSEGGAELFSVDFFEKQAKLSQSAQLYKQICIGAFEKVFALAKCFRAEKYGTSRHLSEATQYEYEQAFIFELETILEVLQETIRYMIKEVKTKNATELKLLEIEILDVPAKIPVLTFKEAINLVYSYTEGKVDERDELDLSPASERALGEWALKEHQSDFVFITHYPTSKRAFYSLPNKQNPEICESFDCIASGFEISSGALRINRYDELKASVIKKGINPETVTDYLNIFKFGLPPHAGFGLGVERFTQAILKKSNIREVTMFPRDVNRLTP